MFFSIPKSVRMCVFLVVSELLFCFIIMDFLPPSICTFIAGCRVFLISTFIYASKFCWSLSTFPFFSGYFFTLHFPSSRFLFFSHKAQANVFRIFFEQFNYFHIFTMAQTHLQLW